MYSLRVLGPNIDPLNWSTAYASVHVFACLLMESLSRIPEIKLSYSANSDRDTIFHDDAILVHDYIDGGLTRAQLERQRGHRSHLASFMEIPYDDFDSCFVFLPERPMRGERDVVIPFPFDEQRLVTPQSSTGKILMDHSWPDITGDPTREDTRFVANALRGREGLTQCKRWELDNTEFADIPGISTTSYIEYLQQTDPFDYFIVTHKGSYNGAITDMACRGTQIIARSGFVTDSQARAYNVKSYSTAAELRSLVSTPVDRVALAEHARSASTPMTEVAQRIHYLLSGRVG